jgi:hydrogenase maturation factor HypF (carbamoyltransferase family)
LRVYRRNSLGILHHKEKDVCDQCGEKFSKYEDLISHARQVHHHPIVKCDECGKEFIHEKDRLHHVREEHEKKLEMREHKVLHEHKIKDPTAPQEDVDEHRRNFSDNF